MLNALTPTLTPEPTPLARPAPQNFADSSNESPSAVTQLLDHVQGMQDSHASLVDTRLQQLDSGRLSTSDMLRLQADLGEFSVRVSMTVRLADEVGRAIQTLTQRS